MSIYYDDNIFNKIATINIGNSYESAFTASGCVGVIKEWINRKFKETEEELTDIFMELLVKIS